MDLCESMLARRMDPMRCDVELPLSGVFYPAGLPLHIATNSPDVLVAAAESWAPFVRQFDKPPLEFRVVVEADGEVAAEPRHRIQRHLFSFVSDAYNFATGDSLAFCASFHLSQATAADHARLRWYFLEAMAYMLLTQRYLVSVHAACVASEGAGILICGKSGSGKSTLSFACARAGFTYVSDDCTWLLAGAADPVAIGNPHQFRFRHDVARHFPELEPCLAREHPNGKLSIEAPAKLFPWLRAAASCSVGCLVFLDRDSGGAAHLESMPSMDAVASLLVEMPSYGAKVNALHEKTIHGLGSLPAWQLRYRTLEEAVRMVGEISL